ncbi:MAG: hypothetical protein EA422_11675 [Gemmatimonadales bacterium]|nr:MAG: hypothetical protein EA422_11675 [Gemmatimonadales bacterium]
MLDLEIRLMNTAIERATTGFHHISMRVGDLEGTTHFWSRLLGLTIWSAEGVAEGPGRSDGEGSASAEGPRTVLLADAQGSPGSMVELVEETSGRRGHWGVGGIHHVALGTRDEGTQLMWKRWLSDRGVPVSGPYDRGYFRSIYFRDPEGHVVEIATAGPGYGYDEPMDRLGESFIGADDHGERMRGSRDERAIHMETHPDPISAISPEMSLQGIHHITGITDDMDRADAFYRDVLGLSLVKRTVNQDDGEARHFFWARYDGTDVAPRSSMTLFDWPGSGYRARSGQGATRHVAFRAGDLAELEGWWEHLEALGLQPHGPVDRGFTHTLTVEAPDGLTVVLATDEPGIAADEPGIASDNAATNLDGYS